MSHQWSAIKLPRPPVSLVAEIAAVDVVGMSAVEGEANVMAGASEGPLIARNGHSKHAGLPFDSGLSTYEAQTASMRVPRLRER